MANKPLKTLNFGGEDTYYLNPEWENIENKPFGETTTYGDTLTWDGNTEGLECFMEVFYKVSDITPTIAELASYTVVVSNGAVISSTDTPVGEVDGLILAGGECVVVIPSDSATAMGVSKGMYFMCANGSYTKSLTIDGYTEFESIEITPIPSKYLPSGQTVFYVYEGATNMYLYTDVLCATKATNNDVAKALEKEKNEIVLSVGNVIYYYPCRITNFAKVSAMNGTAMGEHIEVSCLVMSETTVSELKFYTAEYTG